MKNEVSENISYEAPKDMTPVKKDYSPGLGDRMDAISYTVSFGWLGQATRLKMTTTYEQALEIERKVSNLINGAHQVTFVIGQDALRWGTAPYLIEDSSVPMGDGTPGSGYAKYRRFVDDSHAYNSDVAQIIEPLLAGNMRDNCAVGDEVIPESCYTHTEDGKRKVGWSEGDEAWELLSLYNLYDCGYAQKAWRRNIENWNFRTHLYYDALFPVPEGFYNNPNLTTQYGGKITNTEMEWQAVEREIKYSWENYAISSGQEYLYPRYKGLSVYFSLPYGPVSDDDYLNLWGNSVIIGTRCDPVTNIVWGSEMNGYEEAFQFNGINQPWEAFIRRMMENNLQYLYMLERKPISVINDDKKYEVTFSGNLVSKYDKASKNYTLIENGDFVIANGGERLIPQVGAGCKLYAYSRNGGERKRKLPATWDGINKVDRYILTAENGAVYCDTFDVDENRRITMRMKKCEPYILVPHGDRPTPKTLNFNDMNAGDSVEEYGGISFNVNGNPDFKVYGASARGGFGSPSIYADTEEVSVTAKLGVEKGTILNSIKVGNKGGEGKVVFHSSNSLNPDVMITLPETNEVYKFSTGWKYGEIGNISVKTENTEGVRNVLFDAIVYSSTIAI